VPQCIARTHKHRQDIYLAPIRGLLPNRLGALHPKRFAAKTPELVSADVLLALFGRLRVLPLGDGEDSNRIQKGWFGIACPLVRKLRGITRKPKERDFESEGGQCSIADAQ